MDGRAASQTVTDKISHLIDAGITPVVLSAVTGRKDTHIEHHQLLPWGPSGLRFDFRHLVAKKFGRGVWYRLSTSGGVDSIAAIYDFRASGIRIDASFFMDFSGLS